MRTQASEAISKEDRARVLHREQSVSGSVISMRHSDEAQTLSIQLASR